MDINNTFKVRNTVIQMLKDRGYKLTKTKDVSYEEFMIMYEENNYDIVDDEEKIYVHFFKELKAFSKKDLENIVEKIKEDMKNNDINIIIILKEKYNVTVEKVLTNPLYKNVQLFLFKELFFNITHHQLVPEHILLSPDEAKGILEKYNNINKSHLPKISIRDPISKYYDAKGGDIFKIIRRSPSSGQYTTYRLVR